MGYERETLELLTNTIKTQFDTLSNISMLEFGNQEVYDNYHKVLEFYKENNYQHRIQRNIVKPFFEHLGIQVVQIDYNGKDGAHALDVRNDIRDTITQKFDIITNIGFTEHVGEGDHEYKLISNQYSIFKNMHDLGKIGCLYFHIVPLTGFWYKHGVCDYSLDFFKKLCEFNKYSILKGPYIETYHPEKQAGILYRKTTDEQFMSLENFKLLPGLRSTASD